ncbi:MAG: hypothetical protein ACT4NL_04410 [Pseudomarimonas sp.]
MTSESQLPCAWNATTIARLNARFDVQHDDDISVEDWPAAMADPALVDAALEVYDSVGASADTRALIVELLLNTFEFCSIKRDGNPDWRRTLDRLERDFVEHEASIRNWAEPEDGEPWIISETMQALRERKGSRG